MAPLPSFHLTVPQTVDSNCNCSKWLVQLYQDRYNSVVGPVQPNCSDKPHLLLHVHALLNYSINHSPPTWTLCLFNWRHGDSDTKISYDMIGCSLDWIAWSSQSAPGTVSFFLHFAPCPSNIFRNECPVWSISVRDLAVSFLLRVIAA